MEKIIFELAIILTLLAINGGLAMAELAVISSKKTKLKRLADEGDSRAALALEIARNPGRFLSTVQVGITLVGILAGAVAGATLAEGLEKYIALIPVLEPHAEAISVALVVTVLTYFSVLIGELVPKRLALSHPETVACLIAKPMDFLSRSTAPLVNVLNNSCEKLLNLVGIGDPKDQPISEEEVRLLLDQGLQAGVFKESEKTMVDGVFRLDEMNVSDLMTPKAKTICLNIQDDNELNWRKIAKSGHSRFPVVDGTVDKIIGMVEVKSLFANTALVGKADLKNLMTPALFIPFSMPSTHLLDVLKKGRHPMAIVTDEFGQFSGIITMMDLLQAIVGDIPNPHFHSNPEAVQREDGSWLVDGLLDIRQFEEIVKTAPLKPWEIEGVQTIGGFLMKKLGRLPVEGDKILCQNHSFEIIDMDRHRIDKIIVTEINKESSETIKDFSEQKL